jgi:hypothetical protein
MAVTVADLIGANAEGYEGCRIVVTNVTGVTIGTGVGVSQSGSQIVTYNYGMTPALSPFVVSGTTYKELHGVADFHDPNRQLNPTVQADIVP